MSRYTRFARLPWGFILARSNKHQPSDSDMDRKLNYLILILAILLLGCTVKRSMDISVSGNDLVTPYGAGDAGFHYKSNTTTELLNGR